MTEPSHFDLVGGQTGVDAIVEAFYRHMDSLPEAATIRAMHPTDLTETKNVLRKYLAQWLGGPDHYSRERGHPRLRMRHQPFRIGMAESDAWIRCMRLAFEEVEMPSEIRELLLAQLGKLANMMRNVPET